jgi:GTP-binding protein LepA
LAAYRKNSASKGNVDEPLQALIFDSYNPFRGIEVIFRVINGEIKRQKIKFMAGNEYFADEIGTLKLNQVPKKLFQLAMLVINFRN